jgi:hypothetical protein
MQWKNKKKFAWKNLFINTVDSNMFVLDKVIEKFVVERKVSLN